MTKKQSPVSQWGKLSTRQLHSVQLFEPIRAHDWPLWYSLPRCRQFLPWQGFCLSLCKGWPSCPSQLSLSMSLDSGRFKGCWFSSSSQIGQQWPGTNLGWLQKVGGHSIGQQSISPFCNRTWTTYFMCIKILPDF